MTANPLNYTIEVITRQDENNVLNFLRNNFFKDEPLCQFLGLESTAENPNMELDEFSMDGFDNGWGFKAVNRKGEMIGICLSMQLQRGVEECYTVSSENKFSMIKGLLDYLTEKTDLWANNPDFKKGILVNIASVNKSYTGQGIGTALMNRVKQEAKNQNIDFLLGQCTSHFSAQMCKKVGYKLVYSIPFEEYKPNGQVILKPADPHLAATVWVYKL